MFIDFNFNTINKHLNMLNKNTQSHWGTMTASEVIVHLQDTLKLSLGLSSAKLLTPEDKLPLYVDFLSSDKEMPKEYKVDFLIADKNSNQIELEILIEKHNTFLAEFFSKKTDPDFLMLHPIYGDLNYDLWVLLHQKHYTHHLKQFGLIK